MLVLVASFAALGGFLFGYDLGLIAGALLYMETDLRLSEGTEEVIVGMAKIGAVFGTFIGGALMQAYGRKRAIAWNSVFFISGPVIMAAASDAATLSFGRFIIGLGVGVSAVVVPAYVGEMAPPEKRGAVVITYELMLCLGMIASGVADFALRDARDNWRWMVGVPVLPATAMLLGIFILPESPRWLVIKGRLQDALEVIHNLREGGGGGGMGGLFRGGRRGGIGATIMPGEGRERDRSTAEVEAELMELWSAVEKEYHAQAERRREQGGGGGSRGGRGGGSRGIGGGGGGAGEEVEEGAVSTQPAAAAVVAGTTSTNNNNADADSSSSFFPTLMTMLTDIGGLFHGDERRAFVTALWLAFFNQACCSTSIINFAPKILERSGVDDRDDAVLFASAISVTKAAGVTLSMFLVDRAGRRFLLISGSYAAAAAMSCLAISYALNRAFFALLFMCAFMLAFSASWAGVFWVLMSELFSMRVKSAAISACTALLFLTGAFTDFVFLSAAGAMGGWAFGVVAVVCLAAGAYVQATLPETKGRTLAEVQALLATTSGARRRSGVFRDGDGDGDGDGGGDGWGESVLGWGRRFLARLRGGGAGTSRTSRRYAEVNFS